MSDQDLTARSPAAEEIPLIDVAPLLAGDAAARAAVAARIGAACRDIGFFYIRGHGIVPEAMARVFAEARRFFALPLADKTAVSITRSLHNRGYVALEGESLDPSIRADLKEAFNIGRDLPPDDPDVLAGRPFHGPNLWPELPGWRAAMLAHYDRMKRLCERLHQAFALDLGLMLAHYDRMKRLCERLHQAFALDLGLPEDHFAAMIDRPLATLRLLHYPPQEGRIDPDHLGCAPHTDYGDVTVLAQDGVEGLQVRTRAGEWLEAPAIEGTFLCNIGDLLMRWSNNVYVSTPHRVINRSGRERFSIAFFHDPNDDAVIECLPTCVDAGRPARYGRTTGGQYLAERLNATYDFRRDAS